MCDFLKVDRHPTSVQGRVPRSALQAYDSAELVTVVNSTGIVIVQNTTDSLPDAVFLMPSSEGFVVAGITSCNQVTCLDQRSTCSRKTRARTKS